MNIVMFVIFMFVDLTTVGIMAAVYSGKQKYSEGMILGVHVPSYAAQEPDVKALAETYQRKFKRFFLLQSFLSFALTFLCFWSFTFFMIIWIVWLSYFIAASTLLINGNHRKMYDLKVEHGWIVGNPTQIVMRDAELGTVPDRGPLSHWLHLPAFSVTILFLYGWGKQHLPFGGWEDWILPGCMVLLCAVFWGFHAWSVGHTDEVYSTDAKVNAAVNHLQKQSWAMLWLIGDYLNLASFLCLIYFMNRTNWDAGLGVMVFIVIQVLNILGIGGILWSVKRKRSAILNADTEPLMVDDDVYWRSGWYNNPKDSRLWVQDRMCGTNYTVNLAKTSGKVLMGIMGVGTAAALIWLIVLMLGLEFTNPQVVISSQEVRVEAYAYNLDFGLSEVRDVELVEALPDEKRNRVNGAATDEKLLGKFRGEVSGELRLYISLGDTPILKIETLEYTIYINSQTEGQVQQWYEELKKVLKSS